ncbi:ATP-dependent RNA helicase vasa-like [Malaya genurostris]|uniref:ATP-dependent RNA helicase vasa-like n=1 Tax=Malaya genurostris TaxID=325434 RepID=UPI0026F3A563|nr:ATP-dependent RNA helicase vasa-like [Malaya genurostris]XP_058447292.1 ATP-dependent RNA helicase vasa-like [Malaya genurostris]
MSEWEDNENGKGFGQMSYGDANNSRQDSGYCEDRRDGRGRGFRGTRSGRGGMAGRDHENSFKSYRNHDETNYHENGHDRSGFPGGRGGRGNRGGGRGNFRSEENGVLNRKSGFYSRDKENGSNDQVKTDKPRELYIPPAPTNDEKEIFGSGISSGINFDKFDEIKVNVTGENPPNSIISFNDSGLRDYLLKNVRKSNYIKPTPIQKYAIPIIMDARDLMACAQTGSGKTAAFLLPIINTLLNYAADVKTGSPQVIIIVPTRELALQIFQEARKFALGTILKTCIAYGGTATRHQLDNIHNGCHILVATPGRLMDFVDKQAISFKRIKFVVLDEADRMLDMGFMPAVEKMMNHETMPSKESRQTLMFSATFPGEIQELAGQFLHNYIFVAVGIVGGASTDVEQTIHQVTKFQKRKKLQEILEMADPKGTLVFVETKRNADYLASLLSETTFPTTSIHGDRLQREREDALRDFKSGDMYILIATSVAARGLDIKNVSHVINYDLPKSIDDYVHRIGRTGRVGNKGKATSFYDPESDSGIATGLKKILTQAGQEVPDFLQGVSGGSSFSGASQFGGKDIRARNTEGSRVNALPNQLEPEESWG